MSSKYFVMGNAATARFHYLLDGKRTGEDFISLLKLGEEWRIICQITYHLTE